MALTFKLQTAWIHQCSSSMFIMQLLEKRLQDGQGKGELGVLLDGFPRTRRQAQMLALIADTQLAVNLSLRPEVKARPVSC